jgi:hypothetical protein
MFHLDDVAAAMVAAAGSRGRIIPLPHAVLAAPTGPGSPILAQMLEPGDLRLRAGLGSWIRVVADEDDDLEAMREVVEAVIGGRFEEFLGTTPDGPAGVVGHRVWYPRGERQALDEEHGPIVTHRWPAWG